MQLFRSAESATHAWHTRVQNCTSLCLTWGQSSLGSAWFPSVGSWCSPVCRDALLSACSETGLCLHTHTHTNMVSSPTTQSEPRCEDTQCTEDGLVIIVDKRDNRYWPRPELAIFSISTVFRAMGRALAFSFFWTSTILQPQTVNNHTNI